MEPGTQTKVRTYGRRNKAAAAVNQYFLDSPLSGKMSDADLRKPLTEASANVRPNGAKRPDARKLFSTTEDLAFKDHVRNNQDPAQRVSTPLQLFSTRHVPGLDSPRRVSPRRKTLVTPTPKPVPLSDDLSTSFADLSLVSIHDPQHQRLTRSPIEARKICQRPAHVAPKTQTYLQPLLDCKNVSKCIEEFQSWMDERNGLLDIDKIGEGSFGEVYRARGGEDVVILKLMPLNAQKGKGSRSFTSVSSARNEIRLLSRMSKVPGFVEFRGACVLQGRMPEQLIKQWNTYATSGRTVESKDPSKKDSYAPTQLWLLIEMSDAGESLERGRYQPSSLQQSMTSKSKDPYLPLLLIWDVFWQIAKALAKGEVFAKYEHRDLHLGNICVKETPKSNATKSCQLRAPLVKVKSEEESIMPTYGINNSGIEVTLIDYSLSRASLGPEETLAYDFKNDKALLRGKGDLQYDMYRYMAAIVGKQISSDFVPRTNVMWLYYVLHLLLEASLPSTNDLESGMLQILKELELELHPTKTDTWVWQSASGLIEAGLDNNWFLPEHVMNI